MVCLAQEKSKSDEILAEGKTSLCSLSAKSLKLYRTFLVCSISQLHFDGRPKGSSLLSFPVHILLMSKNVRLKRSS